MKPPPAPPINRGRAERWLNEGRFPPLFIGGGQVGFPFKLSIALLFDYLGRRYLWIVWVDDDELAAVFFSEGAFVVEVGGVLGGGVDVGVEVGHELVVGGLVVEVFGK